MNPKPKNTKSKDAPIKGNKPSKPKGLDFSLKSFYANWLKNIPQ
jgi:hypothetical protein